MWASQSDSTTLCTYSGSVRDAIIAPWLTVRYSVEASYLDEDEDLHSTFLFCLLQWWNVEVVSLLFGAIIL